MPNIYANPEHRQINIIPSVLFLRVLRASAVIISFLLCALCASVVNSHLSLSLLTSHHILLISIFPLIPEPFANPFYAFFH